MINWYNNHMMKFSDIFFESKENLEVNFTVHNYIYGKSYTYFNPDKRINGKWGEGNAQITFNLQPHKPIYLFIHDPNFFLGTDHPSIFPGYFKKFEVKDIFGISFTLKLNCRRRTQLWKKNISLAWQNINFSTDLEGHVRCSI